MIFFHIKTSKSRGDQVQSLKVFFFSKEKNRDGGYQFLSCSFFPFPVLAHVSRANSFAELFVTCILPMWGGPAVSNPQVVGWNPAVGLFYLRFLDYL